MKLYSVLLSVLIALPFNVYADVQYYDGRALSGFSIKARKESPSDFYYCSKNYETKKETDTCVYGANEARGWARDCEGDLGRQMGLAMGLERGMDVGFARTENDPEAIKEGTDQANARDYTDAYNDGQDNAGNRSSDEAYNDAMKRFIYAVDNGAPLDVEPPSREDVDKKAWAEMVSVDIEDTRIGKRKVFDAQWSSGGYEHPFTPAFAKCYEYAPLNIFEVWAYSGDFRWEDFDFLEAARAWERWEKDPELSKSDYWTLKGDMIEYEHKEWKQAKEDLNGDGVIDANDKYLVKEKRYKPDPKFNKEYYQRVWRDGFIKSYDYYAEYEFDLEYANNLDAGYLAGEQLGQQLGPVLAKENAYYNVYSAKYKKNFERGFLDEFSGNYFNVFEITVDNQNAKADIRIKDLEYFDTNNDNVWWRADAINASFDIRNYGGSASGEIGGIMQGEIIRDARKHSLGSIKPLSQRLENTAETEQGPLAYIRNDVETGEREKTAFVVDNQPQPFRPADYITINAPAQLIDVQFENVNRTAGTGTIRVRLENLTNAVKTGLQVEVDIPGAKQIMTREVPEVPADSELPGSLTIPFEFDDPFTLITQSVTARVFLIDAGERFDDMSRQLNAGASSKRKGLAQYLSQLLTNRAKVPAGVDVKTQTGKVAAAIVRQVEQLTTQLGETDAWSKTNVDGTMVGQVLNFFEEVVNQDLLDEDGRTYYDKFGGKVIHFKDNIDTGFLGLSGGKRKPFIQTVIAFSPSSEAETTKGKK